MHSIIACSTIKDEIQAVIPAGMGVEYLDYGLHRYPGTLKERLQERMDNVPAHYSHILLGYGLCSLSTVGLYSRTKTLVIPRVHDCISILLGSRDRYHEEFTREPGTVYLTKGWIDYGSGPLSEYEEYTERLGKDNAHWVVQEMYKNYKRLMFIDTLAGCDLEPYRKHAMESAKFIGVEYQETEGSLEMLKKLVAGSWDKESFVVASPGKMLMRDHFC
jgi:hypothetical protein